MCTVVGTAADVCGSESTIMQNACWRDGGYLYVGLRLEFGVKVGG